MKTITLTLIVLTLTACGGGVPRKELQDLPPLVEIANLNLNQQRAQLRITHRNKTTRENNQLSCQLAIQDQPNWSFTALALPDLTSYTSERIDVQFTGPAINPSKQALPYALDCFLFSENFRREQVIKKGQLFPTPGQPGMYR